MYSRMKRKCSFIVLVVMVVSLLMVSGTPVHADSYSWMESAKKVKINSTIKGVARNNQPPTLMDPWDSYEEYFYFKAPVKMNITITVTMKGTQGVSMSLYNSRGNYMRDSNDWLYNRSKNQNSTILRSTCNAGEYYIRLTELYNSNSEKHPYSLTVQGKLLNSAKITKIRKVSSTKAKIIWKNLGNVTGYELFRKNYGGSYKKVATITRRRNYYIDKGLKRRKNYYYIVRACVIVFYKSDTEAETKNKSNFEFEVMNYDPVLPVRMKTLKIRKENDKLILELTYAEFEWAGIEEFIVDIQLVRYDGTVNTFVQNALFEKKGQNFARFQLQDAGYDLDGIASARVNILVYNIYKSQKKHVEKGSGFSAYSDYSVDELRSARFANSNMVMCMEKNIGKNHQCCCGQVYSNKNNKCPLCGKERRDK